MKKSRSVLLLILVVLALGLCACGKKSESSARKKTSNKLETLQEETTEKPEETEEELEEIAEDGFGDAEIYEEQKINNIFTEGELLNDENLLAKLKDLFSVGEHATVRNLIIDKRQTNIEQKNDNIYCRVDVAGESEGVRGSFYLYCTYYDVGGWQVDAVYVNDEDSIMIYPCSGVDNPELIDRNAARGAGASGVSQQYWEGSQVEILNHQTDLDNYTDKVVFRESVSGRFADMSVEHAKYYMWRKRHGNYYLWEEQKHEVGAVVVSEKLESGEYIFEADDPIYDDQRLVFNKVSDEEAVIAYYTTGNGTTSTKEPYTSTRQILDDHVEYEFPVYTYGTTLTGEYAEVDGIEVLKIYPDNIYLCFRRRIGNTVYDDADDAYIK